MAKPAHRVTGILLGAAVFAGATLGGVPDSRAQQPGGLKDQMIGTWSLVEQWVEQDGRKIQRFGANPKGLAIYDANGHVAIMLMRPDLPKFATNNVMTGTAEEYKAVVLGSTAFYGRWSVNDSDGSLSTRIEGSTFPNWDGQDQKRTVSITGDDMRMCAPGAQMGGTACAIWKRVK